MSENWISCKGCVSSDPTKDTVKVDANQIRDKENVAPLQSTNNKHSKEAHEVSEQASQRWAELQEEATKIRQRQQEAKEAAEAAEAAKAAKEEARLRAEEEEEKKAAEEERRCKEAQRALEEAERLRKEAEAVEAEAAAQEAAEEEKELRRAEQQVEAWCKKHGFQDVNVERKTFKSRKYALHTAVKHQDVEIVKSLIKCGARKDLKDSKGQTPVQLAEKLCNSGSKDGLAQSILAVLQ